MAEDWMSAAESLREKLGLPEDYARRLNADDDWTFIVKAHALIETSLTHLLTTALCRDELSDQLSRMGIRQKLAFARTLNLLDKEKVKFVTALARVRNRLVHDVRNVDFSLEQYLPGESESFVRDLLMASLHDESDLKKLIHESRLILFLSLMFLMACIYLGAETANLELRTRLLPLPPRAAHDARSDVIGHDA